jgi:hypothetical protein
MRDPGNAVASRHRTGGKPGDSSDPSNVLFRRSVMHTTPPFPRRDGQDVSRIPYTGFHIVTNGIPYTHMTQTTTGLLARGRPLAQNPSATATTTQECARSVLVNRASGSQNRSGETSCARLAAMDVVSRGAPVRRPGCAAASRGHKQRDSLSGNHVSPPGCGATPG